MKRKICIITSTRADWGLLSPIARGLKERPDVDITILATNMHLLEKYGHTIDEITADGLTIDYTVPMNDSDSPEHKLKAMAECLTGVGNVLATDRPDAVLILGDRFEMLSAATAALMMRIPIIHIAGGEISEGAIDDSIRHAISKMATLHLTATEDYRRRVIQLGEEPQRVVNTGAIGVYNILNEPTLPVSEIEAFTGVKINSDTLLVTYHPATLDDSPVAEKFGELLKALDRFPNSTIIFTYPNNDPNGAIIIDMIKDYAAANPGRVGAVPSLGRRRYLSALHYVGAVVGNSSSGIVEVPSMGIATVDIGIRQRGRTASDSVIHCGDSAQAITEAINLALSTEGRARAKAAPNPYYRPDTLAIMLETIATSPLPSTKHFYNLP